MKSIQEKRYIETILEEDAIVIEKYQLGKGDYVYLGLSDVYFPYKSWADGHIACLAKFEIPTTERGKLLKLLSKGYKRKLFSLSVFDAIAYTHTTCWNIKRLFWLSLEKWNHFLRPLFRFLSLFFQKFFSLSSVFSLAKSAHYMFVHIEAGIKCVCSNIKYT